jgi:hypothetical protein
LNDRVQSTVRLAPDSLLSQESLRIAREFCQFTRAWQFEADPITIAASTSDYLIQTPDNQAEAIAIEAMTVDKAPSYFRDRDWLDRFIMDWRKRPSDDFRFFTQLTTTSFTFPCVPTRKGTQNGVYYRVSLKPSLAATHLDTDFFNNFGDTLTMGVRAALFAMDGQPWANLKSALYNEKMYLHERALARIRVSKSFGNTQQQMVGMAKFAGR